VDPHAAALVVETSAAVTFVPLDASNHVLLDEAFYNRLAEDRFTPDAELVYMVLTQNIGFVRSGGYYFWDPLTAAIAVLENRIDEISTNSVFITCCMPEHSKLISICITA